MITKIRIDISSGIVEAEGSEPFVKAIYDDFKDRLSKNASRAGKKPEGHMKAATATATKPRSSGKGSGNKVVDDLDLHGDAKTTTLRDFFSSYSPRTNLERSLLFVYYLVQIRKIENVSVNYVYTCYRHISGLKVPGNLKQNIYDAGHKGWLVTKSLDDLSVAVAGINHVEHDLPKPTGE